jgi:hypothetical protein
MRLKHFFLLATALMLLPVSPVQAQSDSYNNPANNSPANNPLPNPPPIVTPISPPPNAERIERDRIVSDLIRSPQQTSSSVTVRCQEPSFSNSWQSESHHSQFQQNGHSEFHHSELHEHEFESSNRSIREQLFEQSENGVEIEIYGQCDDVRVQIGQPAQTIYPAPLNQSSPSHPAVWSAEYNPSDLAPWLTRTGSGWNWFLRQNAPQPAAPPIAPQ